MRAARRAALSASRIARYKRRAVAESSFGCKGEVGIIRTRYTPPPYVSFESFVVVDGKWVRRCVGYDRSIQSRNVE